MNTVVDADPPDTATVATGFTASVGEKNSTDPVGVDASLAATVAVKVTFSQPFGFGLEPSVVVVETGSTTQPGADGKYLQ